MTDRQTVLVLGASGLFGELLARRIVREGIYTLVAAGRGIGALQVLKDQLGCQIELMDREDPTACALALERHLPFAVVDCSGPFQYYGQDPYRFARQVLESNSHYFDIADASAFVGGFKELDQTAKAYGLVAITGASATPAISSAAADVLSADIQRIDSIESAIIPGNKARRTFSVMKAILGQLGQPFEITRYGAKETVYGWDETRQIDLSIPTHAPVTNRLASLVHTPDIDLFPRRYLASTVTASAGLELKTFHRALQLSRWLVRWRVVPTFAPLAAVMRWVASGFLRIGSDTGGMQVVVTGSGDEGTIVRRSWELVANNGRGPEIPTLPVSVLLDKLQDQTVEPGARPALGEVTLDDLQSRFSALKVQTAITEALETPVFRTVLGEQFDSLPVAVQSLHNTVGRAVYEGAAESHGPTGFSGRLAAWLFRFPPKGKGVPVKVTITSKGCGNTKSETWQRDFNGVIFKSHLSVDAEGFAQERFGFMTARLGLHVVDNQLHFPVLKAKIFGCLPVPALLLPTSIAHETIDSQGRFVFDVLIKTPFGARIAHYRGWLIRCSPAV